MKQMIQDDLLGRHLFGRLSKFLAGPIWQYGHYSNSRRDRYCFWNARFAGGDGRSRESCDSELSSNPQNKVICEVWDVLKESILVGHEPLRVYANAHTFGVEGYVHQDSSDLTNYFTTIIFSHPVWHENWGGELLIFNQERTLIEEAIQAQPGRSVHFLGGRPHTARAVSRDCPNLRVSLVVKSQIVRANA